jgi:hypothetical protein
MKKNSASQSGAFNSRVLLAFTLCSVGVGLAILSFAANPPSGTINTTTTTPVTWDGTATGTGALGEGNCQDGLNCDTFSLTVGGTVADWSAAGKRVEVMISPDGQDNYDVVIHQGSNAGPIVDSAAFYGGGIAETAHINPATDGVGIFTVHVIYVTTTGQYHGKATVLLPPPPTPGWSLITSANTSATQQNFLNDVTCASASDCWSVGYYNNGSVAQTLIEHWNGTSWSIVPSPNTSPTQNNYLFGVTCTSAANCLAAVYYYTGSSVAQTLIERWNGTSWSIVLSNNTSLTQNNYLFGVTCASAANCWAVGYFFNGGSNQALIERWDGTSWAIAASPSAAGSLYGVTCSSVSQCWAVGAFFPGSHAQTLIERWDGTSWASVSSANSSSTQDNYLTGVTCASASDCWAVGYYDPTGTGDVGLPIIERLNGPPSNSWSIFTSPNIGITYLTGVTCASSSECWAVGYGIDPDASNPTYYTLIEQWNGSSWQFVGSPNKPNDNYLSGVACASASQCWAVGNSSYYQAGPHSQTLIEEYALTVPALTSVVSRKTHTGVGDFDINLPLTGSPGIECRTGGANGNYMLVFTFPNTLASVGGAILTGGAGSISSSAIGADTHQYIVNLTGIIPPNPPGGENVTVTLNTVHDTENNSGSVAGTMGVLPGDTTGNGQVNSSDISQTKAQSGNAATSANFRTDVTVSGLINSSDISTVKAKSGTALP